MIRVESLGGLRVFQDGQELGSLPAMPLRAAMLVYLAVERDVARERLCYLLWPDSSPERSRHALSQTLYELTKDLGDGWIERSGDRLVVTGDVTADVMALLEAASGGRDQDVIDVYAGPFLEGVTLGGGVEFERWVEDRRSAIQGTVRSAYASTVASATDAEERLRYARAWVELDPLDDDGQHMLIESLALSGDRIGALEQYRVYSDFLRLDLELEPLARTVALVAKIREGGVAGVATRDSPSPRDKPAHETAVPATRGRSKSLDLGPNLSVLRMIGRGTTGSVYLAREPDLKRLVAVKVLDAKLSENVTARARFEREAQSAARIVHPNVAAVHQIGTTSDGRPYLVMPYIRGGTLADRIEAHGPLPPDEVRRLLSELASALSAAHIVGVVHRDVRPANVLYEERTGRIYLADFGVAGVLESGDEEIARLTRTGELLGNAEYVSPEQKEGHQLDDRSDVYSLGVLGRTLLFGESSNTSQASADGPGRELIDLLERATSEHPRHRPSAAELVDALSAKPGRVGRDRKVFGELRRRRLLPFVGAYLAAGIAAMGVIDQLVQQELMPSISYRLALVTFIAGLNGTIVLAWFHGAQGRQSVSGSELALLSIIAVGWVVAMGAILL